MTSADRPSLYELAASQEGYFTPRQAEHPGYSRPLLDHHVRSGRFTRVRRGVYRLVEFPSGHHEDLVIAWLWSVHAGVFSHDTALALHDLSDALPAHLHLTLPASWARRRLRVPEHVRVHFGDVPANERGWSGAVAVTSPLRTLRDCRAEHLPPDILAQALRDGTARGLFARAEAIEFGVDGGTHGVPMSLPEPPEGWAPVYRRMALEDGLTWVGLAELLGAVRSFLDPLLAGVTGVWDSAKWAWAEPVARLDSNHETRG